MHLKISSGQATMTRLILLQCLPFDVTRQWQLIPWSTHPNTSILGTHTITTTFILHRSGLLILLRQLSITKRRTVVNLHSYCMVAMLIYSHGDVYMTVNTLLMPRSHNPDVTDWIWNWFSALKWTDHIRLFLPSSLACLFLKNGITLLCNGPVPCTCCWPIQIIWCYSVI